MMDRLPNDFEVAVKILRYNEKGEQQIIDYLNYWSLDTGYLLSFNFNKIKKPGVERVRIGNKTIFEGTV